MKRKQSETEIMDFSMSHEFNNITRYIKRKRVIAVLVKENHKQPWFKDGDNRL